MFFPAFKCAIKHRNRLIKLLTKMLKNKIWKMPHNFVTSCTECMKKKQLQKFPLIPAYLKKRLQTSLKFANHFDALPLCALIHLRLIWKNLRAHIRVRGDQDKFFLTKLANIFFWPTLYIILSNTHTISASLIHHLRYTSPAIVSCIMNIVCIIVLRFLYVQQIPHMHNKFA